MSDDPSRSPRGAAPRRVLHVVRPAEGGIRQHVLGLLDRTDRARFSLALAAPPDFLRTVPPDAALTGAFPLAIRARSSPPHDLAAAVRLRALARSVDLVHAHGLRAGWVAALAHLSRPFPLVVTAHNLVEPAGRAARLGLSLIGRRACRVIAVSEAVAAGLTACATPPAKIRVIPNGIDLMYFAQIGNAPDVRRLLSVPPEAFVVGCIARLSPEKGIDVLLGAARLTPNLMYLVAGDGPERETLTRALPDNVRLLGRVADTRTLLGAADVLAIPSRREGQGLVALEAMASGVPVAASRVGGLAGMLADGETALLVPSGEAEALAAAVTRLQDEPSLRQRLAANGRRVVHERYDLGQMVEKIEAVYETMPRH